MKILICPFTLLSVSQTPNNEELTDEVEEIFGGLYYEEGGYFHPVGNHPKFIERAERLLAKEKMELVDQVFDWIWSVSSLDLGNKNRAKEDFLSALKSEIEEKEEDNE